MLPVADRVIMVSGANRGIGLAVARNLRDKGYRLSLGGRDPDVAGGATDSGADSSVFQARFLGRRDLGVQGPRRAGILPANGQENDG